ncbi:MAG: glycogen/starch/alpha-glucan phosphorylase [Desulfuromonadales bacterium]|nr:glycogen/starch/alpha-glucan phosphorylase [Desulfuromonadales bacterium]
MDKKTTLSKTDYKWIEELPPLSTGVDALTHAFSHYYTYFLGRNRHNKAFHYHYMALSFTIRDRIMERWKKTYGAYADANCKRGYYLSLEFLMGRALGNALLNLGIDKNTKESLCSLGLELEEIEAAEHDAGLGNGGLGRLAACFLDSCATLQLPVMGYGIRYEYGMFRQRIENGRQVEEPDRWLRGGYPWEFQRLEYIQRIRYGGKTEAYKDARGVLRHRWVETNDVLAIPFDTPIPGYENNTVNTLRLWKAVATDEFNLDEFNSGSYTEAVSTKNEAENITMVLYPNDASENGKELRLKQQYFLASASLQDVIRRWRVVLKGDFKDFAEKNCFQLNDTHPSCAVPELMRILMDEIFMTWDEAWSITCKTMAYTNHTLLPEALEKWPLEIFERLFPRILEIIFEINARLLAQVAFKWPGDNDRLRRMSIIEEGETKQIRMAYLAIAASFSVNGVAELHSELLKKGLFHDFYELWPEKFNNKTNGVTPRRWLCLCNPLLSDLLSKHIGKSWISDLQQIEKISHLADDPEFRKEWQNVRIENKKRLAAMVLNDCGIEFNPLAMFDVQTKRIHEYKRQLLNILHVIHLYNRIKQGDTDNWTDRCVLIGGKAAPGYAMAKLLIKFINNVADIINDDPDVGNKLKVAFLPDYRVTAMEIIAPATDLSEQISTAGKEASGTGNMKFMMNGAVTIGTLDGANIEILEEVGKENFFMFGLTAEEVEKTKANYNPEAIISESRELGQVISIIESGHFNIFEPGIFNPILDAIKSPDDPWLVAADFNSYLKAQTLAAEAYSDKERWTKMSIINSAKSGKFSTDRTIKEYNRDIWHLSQVKPKESL